MLRQLYYALISPHRKYGATPIILTEVRSVQSKIVFLVSSLPTNESRPSHTTKFLIFLDLKMLSNLKFVHWHINYTTILPLFFPYSAIFYHLWQLSTFITQETQLNPIFTVQKLGPTWFNSLLSTLFLFFIFYFWGGGGGNCSFELKQLQSPNQFKKLYKAHLNYCQWNEICSF